MYSCMRCGHMLTADGHCCNCSSGSCFVCDKDRRESAVLLYVRWVKNVFAVLAMFSAGLLALYAGYLVIGSIIFIMHVLLQ